MNKYIDAEKLKAEITRIYNEHPVYISERYEDGVNDGYHGCCDEIVAVIDSLQQEQQKSNLENEIKDYTETLYHETFGNDQGTLDEFDWEDIAAVIDETAHYFYNLNKK